jgi:hypothetical protein
VGLLAWTQAIQLHGSEDEERQFATVRHKLRHPSPGQRLEDQEESIKFVATVRHKLRRPNSEAGQVDICFLVTSNCSSMTTVRGKTYSTKR